MLSQYLPLQNLPSGQTQVSGPVGSLKQKRTAATPTIKQPVLYYCQPTDNNSFQNSQHPQRPNHQNLNPHKENKGNHLQQIYRRQLSPLQSLKKDIDSSQKISQRDFTETRIQKNNQSDKAIYGEDFQIQNKNPQKATFFPQIQPLSVKALESKLLEMKKINAQKTRNQFLQVQRLKHQITRFKQLAQDRQTRNQQKQQIPSDKIIQLKLKLDNLSTTKAEMGQRNSTFLGRISTARHKLSRLSNSTQYLVQTQACCQQILDEELSLSTNKINQKIKQNQILKRRIQKIHRSKKYQQNITFGDILKQIDFLNSECGRMMQKKTNHIIPQIKTLKRKRSEVVETNNNLKNEAFLLEKRTNNIGLVIKQQNLFLANLQDECCGLDDDKSEINKKNCEDQQQLKNLQAKKQFLKSKLAGLLNKLQNVKLQCHAARQSIGPFSDPENCVSPEPQQNINQKKTQTKHSIAQSQNSSLLNQNLQLLVQPNEIPIPNRCSQLTQEIKPKSIQKCFLSQDLQFQKPKYTKTFKKISKKTSKSNIPQNTTMKDSERDISSLKGNLGGTAKALETLNEDLDLNKIQNSKDKPLVRIAVASIFLVFFAVFISGILIVYDL